MKTVEYEGLKFQLPDADTLFGPRIYKWVGEVKKVIDLIKPIRGDVMIEVGACFGVSCISAVGIGKFRKVLAIEPDTRNLDYLSLNVELNKAIGTIFPFYGAVSDRAGSPVLMQSPSANIGGSALAWNEADSSVADAMYPRVPAFTLDAIAEMTGIIPAEVGLVWIDAQGAEGRILDGAEQTLLQTKCPWYIELAPELLRAAGTTAAGLVSLLRPMFRSFIDIRDLSLSEQSISDLPPLWDYYEAKRKDDGHSSHTNILLKR